MIPQPHLPEVAKHCEKKCLWNQSKIEDVENCDLPQI